MGDVKIFALQEAVPAVEVPDVLYVGGIPLLRAALILVIGIPAAWAIARFARDYAIRTYDAQKGLVVHKSVFYPAVLVILVTVLRELGLSLTPLLGAAGIVGIAVGFASQTSVSNIISGFFLLAEAPFKVGDVIKVGETTGVVMTIDMLSVKLRTFDNQMVRIPNEALVKTEVTTVTRFPIRRMDIPVGIAYKEDAGRIREILLEIATANPRVLMEPEPIVIFEGYGASSVDFKLASWTQTPIFLPVRNELFEEIKARFDAEGIEIPFPHRSLYTGSDTAPFPIRIVSDGPVEDGGALEP